MDIKKIIEESYSFSEVIRKLGYKTPSGQLIKKIRESFSDYDTSHFTKNGNRRKYNLITKICPVCEKKFETSEGSRKEKQTCSYACSNIFFRSGPDNGNWKLSSYRTTCFHYHEKKCIICDEKNIVGVHHIDNNRNNNNPENLIPLCPTHHQYYHSNYKYLVKDKIKEYITNWINKKITPRSVT